LVHRPEKLEHQVSETGSVSVIHLMMETDPTSETLYFLFFTITDDGQSPEAQ
jgi:hypothetical protein